MIQVVVIQVICFSGSISLVELAIDQKTTNYGLLTVYQQLAQLMNAIVTFNMKPVRPLSLFDSKVGGM